MHRTIASAKRTGAKNYSGLWWPGLRRKARTKNPAVLVEAGLVRLAVEGLQQLDAL